MLTSKQKGYNIAVMVVSDTPRLYEYIDGLLNAVTVEKNITEDARRIPFLEGAIEALEDMMRGSELDASDK